MEVLDTFNNQGVKSFLEGDLENAEIAYRKAIEEDTENSSAMNNLGFLLVRQGKPDEAKKLFLQSLAINSESDSTHLNIGNLYLSENDLKSSQYHLEKSLSLNPDSAFVFEGLARLYLKLQKYEEAVTALERSIELNPGNTDLKTTYASLLLSLGMIDKSTEAFYEIFLSDPEETEALIGIGITSFIKKDFNVAQNFLKRALAIEPENKKARQNLANCYFSMNEGEKGLKEYERILMLYPDDLEAKTDLAVIHLSLGNTDLAHQYIREVLCIEALPKAVYYEGVILHLKKDFVNAHRILEDLNKTEHSYQRKAFEYLNQYFEN